MEKIKVGHIPHTLSKKTCEIHDEHYVSVNGGGWFCPSCKKAEILKQDKQDSIRIMNEYNKRIKTNRLFKYSIVSDKTILNAEFKTFSVTCDEEKSNLKNARLMAKRLIDGEVFNAIFSGKTGRGKSHLAMSILKAVNEHATNDWKSCLFIAYYELLALIRNSYNDKTMDSEHVWVDRLIDVDVLVIDDLGAEIGAIGSERTSNDFSNRMLYRILNGRQDKSTLITTNLSREQLRQKYDEKTISRLYRKTSGNVLGFYKSEDKRSM